MRIAALSAVALALAAAGAVSAQSQQQITIGANVRVSSDSEKSHFEPMIASAGNGVFIASSNLTGGDNNAWITKPYISRDGGNTWFSVYIPESMSVDQVTLTDLITGDSTVAAGAHGRVFFATLCQARFKTLHDMVTCLYRSDDAGRTWSRTVLNIGDHERFLTDPRNGTVMLSGKGSGKPERLVLYVSHDNGTTYTPLTYAKVIGVAFDPSLLPDGSVFVPYVHELKTAAFYEAALIRGSHVSKPFRLYSEAPQDYKLLMARATQRMLDGKYAEASEPIFVSRGNTIFAVANQYTNGAYRLILRHSKDSGHTWSAPQFIAPGNAWADQFAPSAAINSAGVLGIAWSQMTGRTTYDERFTALPAHGTSFLPVRILSTRDSAPFNDQNVAGEALGFSNSFFQLSGFTTRTSGGDYFGMTADASGAFHPLWIDSSDRTGAQMYTAGVQVADPPSSCTPGSAAPQALKNVKLVFDPSQMDMATETLTIPIRLQNTGKIAIAGPVTYTVKKLQSDEMIRPTTKIPAADMPEITNSSNGKTGAGATFDFSDAFGDYHDLAPGAISNAVDLRMKIANPVMAEAVVTGSVQGVLCK